MISRSVHDIDLFTGGTSESYVPDGVVGPTFACIIGIQFYHLKYGDRYYFEHHGESGSFNLGKYIFSYTELVQTLKYV